MSRKLMMAAMAFAVAGVSEAVPGRVRSNVALSDRSSAVFFEVKRSGDVVVYEDYPTEGGKDVFERRLFRVETDGEGWSWQDGYLPVLKIGADVEMVASGDSLYVRRGADYSRWPEGDATTAAEFELARERVVSYWRRWFDAGLQLPSAGAKADAAWKSSLVQALCSFAGRHPHYGAGFYRVLIHDGFPPTVLSMVETLVQYKHVDEAVEMLSYWLDRFVRADGTIDYYGPSLSEYGGLLWCSSIVMDASPGSAAELAAKLKPLVRNVLEWFQFRSPGGALGPNLILTGVPEADLRSRGKEYFHNNFQVVLGLRAIGPWYARLGDSELSGEIGSAVEMLSRILMRKYEAKKAELGGIPFCSDQKEIPSDVQATLDSGYANYRYYPEMLETGLLPAADAEAYCRYREAHNGEWNGLCFLAVTNWTAETDNWPIASYARGLLEYGMADRFDRLLNAHLEYYLSDDTFTAYEQIANEGDPRRVVAPGCVPAQLVFPRMLAWKLAGYRPWSSYGKGMTVIGGFHSEAGLKDGTGFAIWEEGEDVVFRFEASDSTPCFRRVISKERDLVHSDRVEIYFSAAPELTNLYYSVEIDPCGHVLDYSARFPRKFDFDWKFPTLRTKATIRPGGYSVEGRVARAALEGLGVDVRSCWLGVFRADFRDGGKGVNWYSAVPFCAGAADFHQPKMFFRRSVR